MNCDEDDLNPSFIPPIDCKEKMSFMLDQAHYDRIYKYSHHVCNRKYHMYLLRSLNKMLFLFYYKLHHYVDYKNLIRSINNLRKNTVVDKMSCLICLD